MSKKKTYPVRIPRFSAGIRLQDGKLSGRQNWWACRWMSRWAEMVEGIRFGKGKNYALSGQVTRLAIKGPKVMASVVGVRPTPYSVTVDFRCPGKSAHRRIVAALRAQPMLVARMLADDLPTEVETIFASEGFSLFSGGKLGLGKYDVTTNCSCPDYANPCKHSVAVLLLLGEWIERHPFGLLEFRGFKMEELCDER